MPRDSVSPFTAAAVGLGLVVVTEALLHVTHTLHLQIYVIGVICLAAAVAKGIGAIAAPPALRHGSRAMAIAALVTAGILAPVAALRGYALLVGMA